jgi:hypothetical protein
MEYYWGKRDGERKSPGLQASKLRYCVDRMVEITWPLARF